ncbi:50S ribosomal protein L19 [Candidatus Peregrinibacteria bacterium]|nr:50S ribosomal protein L19 [Candidatus Peregrinibacteria bacterium]
MNQTLVDKVNIKSVKADTPVIRTGYTVRVHQKIKEGGKERIQIFEGLVIRVNSGYGVDKTFTVRKIVSGVGVEKIFPLHSSNIDKVEIVKQAKVRRAKMYYMRELTGKSARLKETYLSEGDEIPLDKSALIKGEINAVADAETLKAESEAAEAEKKAEEAKEETPEEKTE